MLVESVEFFWLFLPSIHPQRYTASSWPFLGAEGLKKPSLTELPSWCSRDHGRHCILLIFPVLPGLLICVPYQSLEFLHGRWTFGAQNSNSGGPRGKKNPWQASRIAGHVLASRSHTETPVNLQRKAVQYWRQQNAVSRNGVAQDWDSSTNCWVLQWQTSARPIGPICQRILICGWVSQWFEACVSY